VRALVLGLLLVLPTASPAENDRGMCGKMVRSLIRFRGTVRSIEPVTLEIASVESENSALRPGTTVNFGLHSPSRMLLRDDDVGKTLDFDAVSRACDGTFGHFDRLRRRLPDESATPFGGWLEVGERYRAEVRRGRDGDLQLTVPMRAPMHHGYRIEWTNAAQHREANMVVFDVVSTEVRPRREMQFTSTYTLTIVTPAGDRP
jgi:hypothetical protein